MYDQETGEAEYEVRPPSVVGAVVAVVVWLDVVGRLPVVGMTEPDAEPVDGLPDVPADEGPVVPGMDVTLGDIVRVG